MQSLFRSEQNKTRWDLVIALIIILAGCFISAFGIFKKLDYRIGRIKQKY